MSPHPNPPPSRGRENWEDVRSRSPMFRRGFASIDSFLCANSADNHSAQLIPRPLIALDGGGSGLTGGHISIGANSWFESCEKWWVSIPNRIRPPPLTIPFGIKNGRG